MSLLAVEDLAVRLVSRDLDLPVVNGVSFGLAAGEVLCLLGESGSGKTMILRALMRLLPPIARVSGGIRLDGTDILGLPQRRLAAIRGSLVSMIFQEPMTALDPVFTIGQQIAETVRRHGHLSASQARARALELLDLVQIPSAKRRLDAYPHELSGGLRQRAMIALALSCRPKLLLADEPTTALDVTVQIQVLLLLRELQRELGMAIIFVTHDLGVAAEMADRIAVTYAGRFVETASASDLLARPAHPYSRGLLRSTVPADGQRRRLDPIAGAPPDLGALPAGCSFQPRCSDADRACMAAMPELSACGDGHAARCIRLAELPAA